jgi:hypothetical protein
MARLSCSVRSTDVMAGESRVSHAAINVLMSLLTGGTILHRLSVASRAVGDASASSRPQWHFIPLVRANSNVHVNTDNARTVALTAPMFLATCEGASDYQFTAPMQEEGA